MALPETTLVLYSPSVVGDSVSGSLERERPATRVAVPATDIRKLEIPGASPVARKVILGGSLAVVGAVVLALLLTSGPSPPIR